jgi:hypothetical protein
LASLRPWVLPSCSAMPTAHWASAIATMLLVKQFLQLVSNA